jgi:membrane protein YqaA with SNARE-associated domain
MRSIAAALFAFVLKFGGLGLLIVGILDSSYLFVPWGNDLLVVALTARKHSIPLMLYYSAMSTIGSVLGCLVLDVTLRPLGEKGLERYLPPRRLKKVEAKVQKSAGKALTLASLAPPPFPFTAFVIGAVALQYSRRRMVLIIAATRMLRFCVLGLLAWRFGRGILRWAQNPVVEGILVALIVICVVGSIVSVILWIKRSRSVPQTART